MTAGVSIIAVSLQLRDLVDKVEHADEFTDMVGAMLGGDASGIGAG